MNRLAQTAFNQLYTRFAGFYDTVARLVSFGEWQEWVATAAVFVPDGAQVLEIGHGPGHLQAVLIERGKPVFGIDASPQMGRLAQTRVRGSAGREPSLARAEATHLPFANAAFDCVVSTFPARFIFADETLHEIRRVLRPAGRVVIVPTARFYKSDPLTALVKLAYRATGQSDLGAFEDEARRRFERAGFSFWKRRVGTARAAVTVWVLRAGPARP